LAGFCSGEAGDIKQRDEMVRCRDRQIIVGMVCQSQDVAWIMCELFEDCIVEPFCPVERQVALLPLNESKVVDDVSTCDDHDPAASERIQPGRQAEMVVHWPECVDGKLQYGNVRIGVYMRQNRPGAVVYAPLVNVKAHPFGLDLLDDFFGEVWVAGSWILDIEELLRKAIEVVYGSGPRHARYGCGAEVPMG